jgi:hypothetical protein
MSDQNNKFHAGLAAVLSFIFSGIGQLYNGQIKKGLLIVFFSVVSIFIFLIGSIFIAFWLLGKLIFHGGLVLGLALFFIGIITICVLGLYSIFDAYKVALKK